MIIIIGRKKDLSSTALNIQKNICHRCAVRLWCNITDDMQRSNHSVHLKPIIAPFGGTESCGVDRVHYADLLCFGFFFFLLSTDAAEFLERSFLQQECRYVLFQLPHSITPTHLTFMSPDKYLCFTAAPMHSDMKCGIRAQSICLADGHENSEPRPFFHRT